MFLIPNLKILKLQTDLIGALDGGARSLLPVAAFGSTFGDPQRPRSTRPDIFRDGVLKPSASHHEGAHSRSWQGAVLLSPQLYLIFIFSWWIASRSLETQNHPWHFAIECLADQGWSGHLW